MFSPHEIPALQRAAEDELVRRGFTATGLLSLAFGVLALFASVVPPADLFLLAVGALLSVAGLWNLTVRNPVGLVLSAFAIGLVGAYNLASPFLAAAAGERASGLWAVLGFWQLVWGWQGYRRWQRFRGALEAETPAPVRQQAAALVDGLRRAKPDREPDLLVLAAGGLTPAIVRVRLGPEVVACLVGAEDDIRLAPRSQVSLEVERASGKVAHATLAIGERRWKGQLKADHLERFRRWQGGAAPLARAA